MGAVGCAEGRGRKRPFASHLPSMDEECVEEAAASAIDDTRSPAPQRRRSARGGFPSTLNNLCACACHPHEHQMTYSGTDTSFTHFPSPILFKS